MERAGETQKMYRADDPVTKIGYKIIYVKSKDRYEIWTQYKDKYGKLRRNRVTYSEAIRREHDLNGLIDYVDNHLVKNHVRLYEGKEFEISAEQPESYTEKDIVKKNVGEESFGRLVVRTETATGSKSEQLEQLFREWEIEQKREPDDVWKITNGGNPNITKGHFRRDGIIDEATFEKERVKVLFLSAEANDNGYSAKTNLTPSSVDDYREYYATGIETYKGRMRERLSELYKAISRTERNAMSNPEAAMHFAVMDINKRGGGALIRDGRHIEAYCKYYQSFIRRELEIISPDVVAIIGTNIYDMELHTKYLGAVSERGKCYFTFGGKKVPVLRLWQTSYTYGKKTLPGYEDNLVIGSQVAKCLEEMKRVGL